MFRIIVVALMSLGLLGALALVGCNAALRAAWRVRAPDDFAPLAGVLETPAREPLLIESVRLWPGEGSTWVGPRWVEVRGGRIHAIYDAPPAHFAGRRLDARGHFLIPGLIDTHTHMLFHGGPDLLTRSRALVPAWLESTQRGEVVPPEVVERGQLRLRAGVTTLRILGDGTYSLRYRDAIARGEVVGPRILTAGLHVNGPDGYVTSGIGASVDPAERKHVALELRRFEDIESQLTAHMDLGIDVVKIATTHGDLGFADARPDLPEAWVREIVRLAHARGLKVAAHTYGTEGDWAALRGGVDSLEHVVNVPGPLDAGFVRDVVAAGVAVCPTLAGSAYSIHKLLENPGWVVDDPGVQAHVDAGTRRSILWTLGVLELPGFTRLALGRPDAFEAWQRWYEQSLANTRALHRAGARLIFGTDVPFVMGNFFHSVGNEIEALRLAGIDDAEILAMATSRAAEAIGLEGRTGAVRIGLDADLVVTPVDPLDDLKAGLEALRWVIARGRVVVDGAAPAGR